MPTGITPFSANNNNNKKKKKKKKTLREKQKVQ
jgi:hypothetical protein